MFIQKSQTMGTNAGCIDESCPVIFAKFLGLTDFWFKTFSVLDFNLTIFFCGVIRVKFMVSIITPSHIPFVLGIKSILSLIITNLAELRSLLTKWTPDSASSNVRKAYRHQYK